MKKIFAKALLAVICTAAVLTYSMEANAESGHLCEAVRDDDSFIASNVYVDCGDNHGLKGTYGLKCKVCGIKMSGSVSGTGNYEPHYYTSYVNAGHGDMSHNFVIHCGKCGHDQRIVLVCEYEKTGYHVAPW